MGFKIKIGVDSANTDRLVAPTYFVLDVTLDVLETIDAALSSRAPARSTLELPIGGAVSMEYDSTVKAKQRIDGEVKLRLLSETNEFYLFVKDNVELGESAMAISIPTFSLRELIAGLLKLKSARPEQSKDRTAHLLQDYIAVRNALKHGPANTRVALLSLSDRGDARTVLIDVRPVVSRLTHLDDHIAIGRQWIALDDVADDMLGQAAIEVFFRSIQLGAREEFDITVKDASGEPIKFHERPAAELGDIRGSWVSSTPLPRITRAELNSREELTAFPKREWRREIMANQVERGYWDWVIRNLDQCAYGVRKQVENHEASQMMSMG